MNTLLSRMLRACMPGFVRHWLRGRQVRAARVPMYRPDLIAMHMANAADGPTNAYNFSASRRLASFGARS